MIEFTPLRRRWFVNLRENVKFLGGKKVEGKMNGERIKIHKEENFVY